MSESQHSARAMIGKGGPLRTTSRDGEPPRRRRGLAECGYWSMVYYIGDEHHQFLKQAHNLFFAQQP